MPTRIVIGLLVLITSLVGCAGSAWRAARSEDTITAYHRFLRDYPETSFTAEARARLDLARLRKKPTREGFEKFQKKHDDPALIAELRPFVEESFFAHARAVGSPDAYRAFLEDFPGGGYEARAEGNLAFIESGGFGGQVDALARFAEEHPESDYAAEAARSVNTVGTRAQDTFSRIGLVIAVDPATPGAERVGRVFRDRAVAAYTRAGLEVVPLRNASQAHEASIGAVLEIRHDEREVRTKLDAGQVTEPGVLAHTEVTLQRTGASKPIWSDVFEYHAPLSARRAGVSILFGPGSHSSYWAELDGTFFVPIARWSTQHTARTPQSFAKPAVAIEMVGSRAVVLFGDGDFQMYDLGDPANPVRLGEYRRKRDLASFTGLTVHGSRVGVYGADGVEIVLLDGRGTRREIAFGRESVGSVAGLAAAGGAWVAATNRGLLELDPASGAVKPLVPRPILGMDRSGEHLVFTDGTSLYVSTLGYLRGGRVESEMRLGRGFHPESVRVHGRTAVVMGARDAVWVDLRNPLKPRLLSRIGGNESGRVLDAAVVGNRLFLLGPRGLQVVDRSGERVVDSVDVQTRERMDVAGRHLVMIGDDHLQVVDATPFVASSPASATR